MFAAPPVRKGMTANLFKETPEVEVLDAAIAMDVVLRRALAEANQTQAIGVSTGIFLSSAKIGKVVESYLREASKIVWWMD